MNDSRIQFIDSLIELATKDDKIILIVPDVGFNYIEKFQEKFPERFFNLGVTEQSTVIIAAALALDGWKPYVYSMINFVVFRPYEMVRNAVVYHKANVKLIGVKGSEKYKFLGFSHNVFDGEPGNVLDHLRIQQFYPKPEEVKSIMDLAYDLHRPCYIQL